MTAVELVASVVRGDITEWSADAGVGEQDFLEAAVHHNVVPLVAWRLRAARTFDAWPVAVGDELERLALHAKILNEIWFLNELPNVIQALHDAKVPCLLIKGAGLSYSVYPEAWLRPRNDNDLLVPPGDAARAGDVLGKLGYAQLHVLEDENQQPYVKTDGHGGAHVIDLHWRLSNRPLFAHLLSFGELSAQSIPVGALGAHARTLGHVHALLLSCTHLAAHHRNREHLLWCYDGHLLASRLEPAEFEEFVALARARGVAEICGTNLRRAMSRFHTAVPREVLEGLDVTGEATAAYLDPKSWRGDVRLSDFRLLPTWRAKLKMIRDVTLPSADYMLERYDASNRLLLPALHLHRLTRGTWRLLRRLALSQGRARVSPPSLS